jgi:hypothetical protein
MNVENVKVLFCEILGDCSVLSHPLTSLIIILAKVTEITKLKGVPEITKLRMPSTSPWRSTKDGPVNLCDLTWAAGDFTSHKKTILVEHCSSIPEEQQTNNEGAPVAGKYD